MFFGCITSSMSLTSTLGVGDGAQLGSGSNPQDENRRDNAIKDISFFIA